VALIVDRPPPGFELSLAEEPFDEVVYPAELDIAPLEPWLFQHDVVEVCTAVKGPYLRQACESGVDAVLYLDPDIAVFGTLEPVLEELATADILLTPHQLDPDTARDLILDNELATLRTGIYNLGFIAVRAGGEGLRFARWWESRLRTFCFDDVPNGLFVDQRWCDHAPGLFDRVKILRDPGLNVASWNISQRRVAIERSGAITANGSPLRFFHFTKLGPVGETATAKQAGDNFEVFELWRWYKGQVAAAAEPAIPHGWWFYGRFSDGSPIERRHRLLYRTRPDLQRRFPEPYGSGLGSFKAWWDAQQSNRAVSERAS
jgi:hypothetical protein